MDDPDVEAPSSKLREELATFRASLIGELQAMIAWQHEELLNNLRHPSSNTHLQECKVVAPLDLSTSSSVPMVNPSETGKTPSQEPGHVMSGKCLQDNEDCEKDKKTPIFTKESSFRLRDQPKEEDGDVNGEANVPLKVDGAFSSMFDHSPLDSDDLAQPQYHVENHYATKGYAQELARSEIFSDVTMAVIAINAVYIGVDVDWNEEDSLYDSLWPFIICDNAFCAFFTFELLVRFLAFQKKLDCLRDGWFRFDAFLVAFMILETWIVAPIVALMSFGGGTGVPVQPLRLLRLFRLTRMARLMRSLPELVTMTRGMKVASRAVLSSLLMVIVMIYTFAIVLNMGLKEEDNLNASLEPRNFATIPRTMWTLFMDGTLMDSTGVVLTELLFSGRPMCWICLVIFMIFILLSAITVMNMLIGVLCEVVSKVGEAERDEGAIRITKASILNDLKKYENEVGEISKASLMEVLANKQSRAVLESLNIDRLFMLELSEVLFPNEDSSVPIKVIMQSMLLCRGDLPVTVQHIASAQAASSCWLEQFEKRLEKKLEELKNGPRHQHIPSRMDQQVELTNQTGHQRFVLL